MKDLEATTTFVLPHPGQIPDAESLIKIIHEIENHLTALEQGVYSYLMQFMTAEYENGFDFSYKGNAIEVKIHDEFYLIVLNGKEVINSNDETRLWFRVLRIIQNIEKS